MKSIARMMKIMHGALAIAGFCLALSPFAMGQAHPDSVPDDSKNHWIYESLADLQSEGLSLGRPEWLGSGVRPSSRYELAVAIGASLNRVHEEASRLQLLNETVARYGGATDKAEAMKASEASVRSDVMRLAKAMPRFRKELEAMVATFSKELTVLGVDVPSAVGQLRRDSARITSLRPAKIGEALQPFPDVPESHWASQATRNLRSQLVLRGDAKGRFGG